MKEQTPEPAPDAVTNSIHGGFEKKGGKANVPSGDMDFSWAYCST